MSIYQLTDEHHLFQQAIQRWTEEQLVPNIREMEEQYHAPPQLMNRLEELGFLTATLPEEIGGSDGDFTMNVILLEALGRAGAVGFAQAVKQHAAMALPILSKSESLQAFLKESIAQQKVFTFITQHGEESSLLPMVINGINAHLLVVHHPTKHQLQIFDLEDSSIQVEKNNYFVGWRTANFAKVNLNDAKPLHSIEIDAEMTSLIVAQEQVLSAAIMAGVAHTTFAKSKQYAQERTQFDGPLTQFQVLRHKLVEIAVEKEKLKHFIYTASFAYGSDPFLTLAPLLRMSTEKSVPLITEMGQQIFGGSGYMMEFDIQRYWRDSEMYYVLNQELDSYEDIGRSLLKERENAVVFN